MGEAREQGWRYICSDELAPLRDKSADRVSRRLRELAHTLVEEEAPIQEAPAQVEEAPIQEEEAPEGPADPEPPVRDTEQVTINITDLSIQNPIAVQIW